MKHAQLQYDANALTARISTEILLILDRENPTYWDDLAASEALQITLERKIERLTKDWINQKTDENKPKAPISDGLDEESAEGEG